MNDKFAIIGVNRIANFSIRTTLENHCCRDFLIRTFAIEPAAYAGERWNLGSGLVTGKSPKPLYLRVSNPWDKIIGYGFFRPHTTRPLLFYQGIINGVPDTVPDRTRDRRGKRHRFCRR